MKTDQHMRLVDCEVRLAKKKLPRLSQLTTPQLRLQENFFGQPAGQLDRQSLLNEYSADVKQGAAQEWVAKDAKVDAEHLAYDVQHKMFSSAKVVALFCLTFLRLLQGIAPARLSGTLLTHNNDL